MYNLSDEVISQIAKLVQLAIITGTDIVDNLRMMSLEQDGETGSLVLTDEYRGISEDQIQKLLAELESSQQVPAEG
mgnify:CR=1 FL=1|tara:strand:+ start:560 stop:787 length:228 start_codon:yes stop_codon:yes gene_type:complete